MCRLAVRVDTLQQWRTAAAVSARSGRSQPAAITDRLGFRDCAVPSVAIIRAAFDCVHVSGTHFDLGGTGKEMVWTSAAHVPTVAVLQDVAERKTTGRSGVHVQ